MSIKTKSKLLTACSLLAFTQAMNSVQAASPTVTSPSGIPAPSISDAFTTANGSADAGDIISVEIPAAGDNSLISSPAVLFNKTSGNLTVRNSDILSGIIVLTRGLRPTGANPGLVFTIGTLNQPIANGPTVTIVDAYGIFQTINVLSGTLRPEPLQLVSQNLIGGSIFNGTNTFSQFGSPSSLLTISKDARVIFEHGNSPNLKIDGDGTLVIRQNFQLNDTSYDGSTIKNIDVEGFLDINAAITLPNANLTTDSTSTIYVQNATIGGDITHNGNTLFVSNSTVNGNVTHNGFRTFIQDSTVQGDIISNGSRFEFYSSTLDGNFTHNNGIAFVNGLIRGNVINNAELRIVPGQNVLNVTGNFTQAPSGIMSITVDDTMADFLHVTGSANIMGEIRIGDVSSAPIAIGKEYRVISAAGGLTNTANIISNPNLPLLLFYTETRGNDLFIITGVQTLQEDSSFTGKTSGNFFQDILGNAAAGSELANAFQNLVRMSLDEAQDFIKQLGPGQNNNRFFSIQNNFSALLGQIRDHLIDLGTLEGDGFVNSLLFQPNARHHAVVLRRTGLDFHNKAMRSDKKTMVLLEDALKHAPTVAQRPQIFSYNGVSSVWGQLFAGHREKKAKQLFNGYSNTSGGIVMGADVKLNPNLVVGGALSYQHASITLDNNRGDSAVRSADVSLYAAMNALTLPLNSTLYLNCAATVGASHHDATRTVSVGVPGQTPVTFDAKSKHLSLDTNIAGEAGLIFKTPYVSIKPYVASDVTLVRESKYTEKNAGAFNLQVDGRSAAVVDAEVGGEVWKKFTSGTYTIIPSARAGFARKRLLRGKRMRATLVNQSGRFQALGEALRQGYARPAANLKVTNNEGISMSTYYKGEFGQRYKSHEGGIKVSKAF